MVQAGVERIEAKEETGNPRNWKPSFDLSCKGYDQIAFAVSTCCGDCRDSDFMQGLSS